MHVLAGKLPTQPMLQSMQTGLHILEPMSAKIQIYALGTLHVIRDTVAVTESDWHTRQARQLLKILITERPRPVSAECARFRAHADAGRPRGAALRNERRPPSLQRLPDYRGPGGLEPRA